ncbi:glutathione S-transferase family protein [Terrihabitans sp. B22-R8]|uniref:glutathione S-transferase family protein n=1 Tax=Terrihabitans sp. B22-R8 TaxID=3425128 RepID=UPI00403D047A
MYKLYSMQSSANSYKARLALALLGAPFQLLDVDILAGGNRTSDYLRMNPAGQVPILILADGRALPESGAIMHYLAEGSPLLPQEPFSRAETLRWMFFEQHSHDPFIGQARFWLALQKGGRELKQNLLEEWEDRGYEALRVMETYLAAHPFFGGEAPTLADIALYANTHLAHEGGFDLTPFQAVRIWLQRFSRQNGFVPMSWRPSTETSGSTPADRLHTAGS